MAENERRSFDILSVKNDAKLLAREKTDVKEGRGDEDLRWRRLLTVFQRRRGFPEDDETSSE
jgi:hypothetical protein